MFSFDDERMCVKSHGAMVSFRNPLDVGEVDKIGVLPLLLLPLLQQILN